MKKNWILGLMVLVLAGCYMDNEEELNPRGPIAPPQGPVSYAKDIQPLLSTHCATAGCHDASGLGGGYDFTHYEGVYQASSRMIGALRHEAGYSPMPKGAPALDPQTVHLISLWISEGAQNN